MNSPIQQFIVAVKQLRDAVLDIPKKLSVLHDDIQQHINAIDEARDTQEKRSQAQPPTFVGELHLPHSYQAEKRTSDRRKQRRERWALFVHWLTFFAVLYYAIVAHKQLKKTQDALNAANAANKNAVRAERPWIGNIKFSAQNFAPGVVTNVRFTIINAGRRPAYVILEEIGSHEYSTFPDNPFYEPLTVKPSHPIIVPGIGAEINGKVRGDPNVFRPKSGSKFYVYTHVDYRDVGTQETHTTRICEVYLPEWKDFFACEAYNYAD